MESHSRAVARKVENGLKVFLAAIHERALCCLSAFSTAPDSLASRDSLTFLR